MSHPSACDSDRGKLVAFALSLGGHFVLAVVFLTLSSTRSELDAQPVNLDQPAVEMAFYFEPSQIQVESEAEDPLPEEVMEQDEETKIFIPGNASASVAPRTINPKTKFISDLSSEAASELPPDPATSKPLPSQEGKEIPHLGMENREFIDGGGLPESAETAPPQMTQESLDPAFLEPNLVKEVSEEEMRMDPAVEPSSQEKKVVKLPEIQEAPSRTVAMDQLETPVLDPVPSEPLSPSVPPELVKQMPAPPMNPSSKESPAVTFRDPLLPDGENQLSDTKTRLSGSISNRGDASVEAVATASGQYMAKIRAEIGKNWLRKKSLHPDRFTYSHITIRMEIMRDGKLQNLRIVFADADALIRDLTLAAVQESKIPPMPPEVIAELNGERMEMDFSFLIH